MFVEMQLPNYTLMNARFTLLLLAFLSTTAAFSQQNQRNVVARRTPSLSFGLQVAQPRNEFSDSFEGYPVGIAAQFMSNLRRSPFELGFGFSWMNQGEKNQDIYIFQGVDAVGDDVFEKGSISVRNNIYTYTGSARFKPFAGAVQPYGELIAGIQNFSTRNIISSDDNSASDIKERAHRDFALTYGWAAGLKVRLTQNIQVEGRFSNMLGGNIDFVDQNSIVINDVGDLEFSRISSKTDMWLFQAGISLEF
jgi:opacity protein-like surface antigen